MSDVVLSFLFAWLNHRESMSAIKTFSKPFYNILEFSKKNQHLKSMYHTSLFLSNEKNDKNRKMYEGNYLDFQSFFNILIFNGEFWKTILSGQNGIFKYSIIWFLQRLLEADGGEQRSTRTTDGLGCWIHVTCILRACSCRWWQATRWRMLS